MENCVFCEIVNKQAQAEIVYEDVDTLAFLDKYPQSRGHLQFIPKTHVRWIYELPDMGQFFTTAGKIIRGIIPVLGADHVTIGTFGHQVSHAHLWIVPQYKQEVTLKEWRKTQTDPKEITKLAELLHSAIFKEVSNA